MRSRRRCGPATRRPTCATRASGPPPGARRPGSASTAWTPGSRPLPRRPPPARRRRACRPGSGSASGPVTSCCWTCRSRWPRPSPPAARPWNRCWRRPPRWAWPSSRTAPRWETGRSPVAWTGSCPYKQLVSVGPLPAPLGLITRRQQVAALAKGGETVPCPAALYGSILAGFKAMTSSYQARYDNAVLVMTAGVDNAPGDISAADLIRQLRTLYNPKRRVEIIVIKFGNAGTSTRCSRSPAPPAARRTTSPTRRRSARCSSARSRAGSAPPTAAPSRHDRAAGSAAKKFLTAL